jgi:anti-anti-sigma factor
MKESGVSITLEQSETLSVIRLEGLIDISCAAELKKLLLQAFANGKEMRVSLERAGDLDVTAVQLLWAAVREARKSGVGFTFAGVMPKEIAATLADAGFEKFPVSEIGK